MRTLKYKRVYASTMTAQDVFDISVQEHTVSSIFVNDAGGGTLHVYAVMDDDDGTEPILALIEDVTVAASSTGATVKHYPYKTPHMRLKYTSTSSSGTVRIHATTAR